MGEFQSQEDMQFYAKTQLLGQDFPMLGQPTAQKQQQYQDSSTGVTRAEMSVKKHHLRIQSANAFRPDEMFLSSFMSRVDGRTMTPQQQAHLAAIQGTQAHTIKNFLSSSQHDLNGKNVVF